MDKVLILSIIIVFIGLILMIAIDNMTVKIVSAFIVAMAIIFNTADVYQFLPDSVTGINSDLGEVLYLKEEINPEKEEESPEKNIPEEEFISPTKNLLQGSWIYRDNAGVVALGFEDDRISLAVLTNDEESSGMSGRYSLSGNEVIITYTLIASNEKISNLVGMNKKDILYIKLSGDGQKCYVSYDDNTYIPFIKNE